MAEQEASGLQVLLSTLQSSCDKDVILNILSVLTDLLSLGTGRRIHYVISKGGSEALLQALLAAATRTEPPDHSTLLPLLRLLARVGQRDRKFGLKVQKAEATDIILSLTRKNLGHHLPLTHCLWVLRVCASNVTTGTMLGINGAMELLFKVITPYSKRHVRTVRSRFARETMLSTEGLSLPAHSFFPFGELVGYIGKDGTSWAECCVEGNTGDLADKPISLTLVHASEINKHLTLSQDPLYAIPIAVLYRLFFEMLDSLRAAIGALAALLKSRHEKLQAFGVDCSGSCIQMSKLCLLGESNSRRAVNRGYLAELLRLYQDWHRNDVSNNYIYIRRGLLLCLKYITNIQLGRETFLGSQGMEILFTSVQDCLSCKNLDPITTTATQILRKCYPKENLPVRTVRSSYSFPLPGNAKAEPSCEGSEGDYESDGEEETEKDLDTEDEQSKEEFSYLIWVRLHIDAKELSAVKGSDTVLIPGSLMVKIILWGICNISAFLLLEDYDLETDVNKLKSRPVLDRPEEELGQYESLCPELSLNFQELELESKEEKSLDDRTESLPSTPSHFIPSATSVKHPNCRWRNQSVTEMGPDPGKEDFKVPLQSWRKKEECRWDQSDEKRDIAEAAWDINICEEEDPARSRLFALRPLPKDGAWYKKMFCPHCEASTSPCPEGSLESSDTARNLLEKHQGVVLFHSPYFYAARAQCVKSIPGYRDLAFPDFWGHQPPPYSKPMLERKHGVQRDKVLDDVRRLIQPDDVIGRTVFDLDEPRFEYDLIMNADVNSNQHHQWFYFEVRDMKLAVPYRFNVINCEKFNSQFNYGMQLVMYSVKEALQGRPRWIRAGHDICYYKNHYHCNATAGGGMRGKFYYTLTFSIKFPHKDDVCYLAYHYPYTYSTMMMFKETAFNIWEKASQTFTVQNMSVNSLLIRLMKGCADIQIECDTYCFLVPDDLMGTNYFE
ncbi:hypothetical protein WISP_114096 [Willisornis vidua]|uniref:CBPC4 carboxypeptidase n=1 Tax=Willisornis vidua TaxID=1566151 RepID=A0ABQ9CUD1_9PASS|nr:hypothetical protein WISP_114096 [Willisornis vidua]